ncbi:MAG TPA: non-heme iron oxygenase ferredoxin subunit [Acidimicrobiales bacterium]|nr:non-heme iron oxygenase ferredoxin subunit [Acidimicrobiales bacterium]
MAESVRLCGRDELEVGTARCFEVGGVRIALVRVDDGFHAVGDTCSHEDYSLSEGEVLVEECEIECWKHGSMFDLRTGEARSLPATRPVPVFRVHLEGDDVMVDVP